MSKKLFMQTASVIFGLSLLAGCGQGSSGGSGGNSSGEWTLVQIGGDRQGSGQSGNDPYATYDGERVAADDRFDGEGIDDFVMRIEQRSRRNPAQSVAGGQTAGQSMNQSGQASQTGQVSSQNIAGQSAQMAQTGQATTRLAGTVPPNTGKPVPGLSGNQGAGTTGAVASTSGSSVKGSGFVYPPSGSTPMHKEYDAALARITKDNNLTGGRTDLIAFIKRYPTSALVPNALYWIGETFYSQRQYEEAILVFKRVGIDYPNTDKAADSLLKLVLSYRSVGDEANARDFARMLKADYPQSRAARNTIVQQL